MKKLNYLIILPTLLQACYWGMMKVALPILPKLHIIMGVSEHQIHLILSLSFILSGLANIVWGHILDRLSFRFFIISTFLLCTGTLFLTATAKNFWVFSIFYLFSCVILTSYSVYSRAFPGIYFTDPKAIKTSLSFRLVGGFSAAFIAPFIGGIISSFFGWRYTFVVIIFWLFLIQIISSYFKFDKSFNPNNQAVNAVSILKIMRKQLKNKNFLKNLLILCCSYAVTQSYIISIPFWLDKYYSIPVHQVAFYLFPLLLPGMVVPLISSYLLKYFSQENLLKFYFILFASSGVLALLIWKLNFSTPWVWVIPGVFANIATVAMAPVINYRAIETITEYKSTASGLLGTCSYIFGGCAMYFTMFITLKTFYFEGVFILFIALIIFILLYPTSRKTSFFRL